MKSAKKIEALKKQIIFLACLDFLIMNNIKNAIFVNINPLAHMEAIDSLNAKDDVNIRKNKFNMLTKIIILLDIVVLS